MSNLRVYGNAPYTVAVIHGGPGAPGTMAPVARELSVDWGVLEPLQTADSLEGQVHALRAVLEAHGDMPVTLIGSSWGAMLSYMLAARYPGCVRKAILVGSGVFADHYAAGIQALRLSRLTAAERDDARRLMAALSDPAEQHKDAIFARLGALFERADAYDSLTLDSHALACQYDSYQRVWPEVSALRASGQLLELGTRIACPIACPIVAIHGDYDPHPAAGVCDPLTRVVRDCRFILLDRCGHLPWIERQARDTFFTALREELR
jgi:pimeloyl-ACP methyl ester carboxylesterase